jgi:cupin 2 domain-containing protein
MTDNLFAGLPSPSTDELVQVMASGRYVRIERIVSQGHSSPPGFWYDQDQCEWVSLLQGSAKLQFEDEPGPRSLFRGDYVLIDAHRRHRVEWTSPNEPTIWLAVYFDASEDGQ